MSDTHSPLELQLEAMREEERREKAASAELLASLQETAMANRQGDVAVPAEALLQLLSHIQELRRDLAAVQTFIRDGELEEEGYSPARWAWNKLLLEFEAETRLDLHDLQIIPDPLIDRLDKAEDKLAEVRRLVRDAGYSVKASALRLVVDQDT